MPLNKFPKCRLNYRLLSKTSSTTIKNGAEKILNRVEVMRTALTKQIETLDAQASLIRALVNVE